VTLRDPALRAITKAGYFAPSNATPPGRRQKGMIEIAEALRSTIPLPALTLTIDDLVRHPDSGRIEFTALLKSKNTIWQTADDGKSTLNLTLAAASLDKGGNILASKVETVTVSDESQNARLLAETPAKAPVSLRVPAKAQSVRVVMQIAQDGRFGAVQLNSEVLAAAPQAPTPALGSFRGRPPATLLFLRRAP
jgi:hypothetical protein